MAADSCASNLHDSMDKLWFYQNILLFEPNVFSHEPMLTGAKNSQAKAQIRQPAYKNKRPARLNIAIGQPLFQLQPPPRSKIRPRSSSPSLHTSSQPKSERKSNKVRRYRSLTQLENDELKGFLDMGFMFPRDKLSPHTMSMLPGLQRINKRNDGVDERHIRRPYLSESWLVSRSDSRLLNRQMLPKSTKSEDVKEHLKFWARRVAMLVHEGP